VHGLLRHAAHPSLERVTFLVPAVHGRAALNALECAPEHARTIRVAALGGEGGEEGEREPGVVRVSNRMTQAKSLSR